MIFGAYSIKYTKKAEVRILDANFLFNEKMLTMFYFMVSNLNHTMFSSGLRF